MKKGSIIDRIQFRTKINDLCDKRISWSALNAAYRCLGREAGEMPINNTGKSYNHISPHQLNKSVVQSQVWNQNPYNSSKSIKQNPLSILKLVKERAVSILVQFDSE